MRLTDLDPQACSATTGADAAFNFICPLCRKGRVVVSVVLGAQREGVHAHGTTALPPEWDRMTLTPSVADEGKCSATKRGCPGWHGFIVEGEAR